MYKNDAIAEKMRLMARKIKTQFNKISYTNFFFGEKDVGGVEDDDEATEITPLFARVKAHTNDDDDFVDNSRVKEVKLSIHYDKFDHNECARKPWRIPSNFLIDALRWPITFLLWCTIPDCRRFPKFYVLTFINCVAWVLFLSYFIASLITVVGEI